MGPRAAQTPSLEELDVKTCPLEANGALDTPWRGMLQALIRRQNEPLVRPPQKAALTGYTVWLGKQEPGLQVVSLSPGFIDTPMCAGYGAKLTPEVLGGMARG